LHDALTSDLADLRQLLGIQDLTGKINLQGQAHGTWPALNAEGALHADNLLYQGNHLQTLHLTYTGAQLGDQPQVTAQLRAQQARAGTIPVENVTLDAAYQAADRQVRFALEVRQATATGGKMHGVLILEPTAQQIVLEEVLVQLPQRPWRSVAPLRVTLEPQGLQIHEARLAHADESITLSGTVAAAHLQSINLPLSHLLPSSL